jgi:hypothetical protein
MDKTEYKANVHPTASIPSYNAGIMPCLKYAVWEVERSNMIEGRKGINSEALLGCSCYFV